MVAQISDIRRNQKEQNNDCSISLYTFGIKRILENIELYRMRVSLTSQFPLGKMMRASLNQLNSNLRKLEKIGTDLSIRLKHARSMGSFIGSESLMEELETEVDLFYEMMKIQKQQYMKVVII